MQYFKKIFIKILVMILLIWLVDDLVVGTLLEPANYYGHYANIDMKRAEGKIDTVFLGSSWTYFGYDCGLYDERMGTVSFNAGSIGQAVPDSYYYLKEILKKNPVKTVYYNIHHLKLQSPGDGVSSANVNDRLNGFNKVSHMFKALEKDEIKYVLKSYRYRSEIGSSDIGKTIKEKLNINYLKGIADPKKTSYELMGYVPVDGHLKQGNNENFKGTGVAWKVTQIKDYNMEYLNKMISLCKEQGIKFVIVTPPFSMGHLQASIRYNDFSEFMTSYADEQGVPFYDFNKLVDSPFESDELFADTNHLSRNGAEIFTGLICDIAEKQDVQFYDHFYQRNIFDYCAGVKLNIKEKNGNKYLSAESANDTDMTVLYRFLIKNDSDGRWDTLSDYSKNDTLYLTENPLYATYRVEAKSSSSDNEFDAYSEAVVETEVGLTLIGNYLPETHTVHLVSTVDLEQVEFCFRIWQPDGSFSMLRDYSDDNEFDFQVPVEGMYRFKVEVRDARTKQKAGETQFFINTLE